MNDVYVRGCGAVSPAGWGMDRLRDAIQSAEPIPTSKVFRPDSDYPLPARRVPAPSPRPAFFAHARLRRTSSISQFVLAAALEALGEDADRVRDGSSRLGILYCVMAGCVQYSRRFYDETLADPATASPLVFPETVFNAPSSHLSSFLGTMAVNYTVVGDPGTFLQALALAANWLVEGRLDGCLVIGAEECDWIMLDASRIFHRRIVLSEGAGALYLRAQPNASPAVQIRAVTDSHLFHNQRQKIMAASATRSQLPVAPAGQLLCDSRQQSPRLDAAETLAWEDWSGPRLSPKTVLGEAFMASSAWQCALAADSLRNGVLTAANISVVGCNQQAIAAQFVIGPARVS